MDPKLICKIWEIEFDTPKKLNRHMGRTTPCKKKSNVITDINSKNKRTNIKENSNSNIEENKQESFKKDENISEILPPILFDNTQDIPPQILSDDEKKLKEKKEIDELFSQAKNIIGSIALSIISLIN